MTKSPIHLTREQVRNLDRLAIEQYHIPGIILMENAARAVADAACALLRLPLYAGERLGRWPFASPCPRSVPEEGVVVNGTPKNAGLLTENPLPPPANPQALILCGGGNNGGDGLAAARHLHNRGVNVSIALASDPAKYQDDALTNWNIVIAMGLKIVDATTSAIADSQAHLLIDAIFGTGLTQVPRDPFPALAAAVEDHRGPILAIDLPSGMDCDTGKPLGACIRATHTITLVALKAGFQNPDANRYTGAVAIGDIGCPHELISRMAKR